MTWPIAKATSSISSRFSPARSPENIPQPVNPASKTVIETKVGVTQTLRSTSKIIRF